MRYAIIMLAVLSSPAWAGEADRGHEFKDTREAIIRQLSPEGRYCRECHQRKPERQVYVKPVAPIPLPETALLFGAGLAAIAAWRRG